jgi:putative phosphoesterase
MKILIISDSHGHIVNLKAAIEIGKKANIKSIIHCGDWDDLAAFRAAQAFGLPIYSVLGNADVDSDLEDALRFECKKYDPYLLELEFEGKKIGVTHRVDIKNEKLYDFKIIFSGHYHSKEEKVINWTKFIRPGALINGINFAIYETVSGTIEFINEEG